MDNPLTIHNIKSSYYDLDKLNIDDESNEEYEYTCVHINIQSLPAKFKKIKYLISEFQEQNIDIDFILLCETFLTDNIAQQFNIPGYNLLSRNRNQNFDYLKVNSLKNTQYLLCTFLNNGLVPTITLPTRIATTGNTIKTVRTLIDNLYIFSKHNPILKSGILYADFSDHLPILMFVGKKKRKKKNKPLVIKKRFFSPEILQNISNELQGTNWECIINLDTNKAYEHFTTIIKNCIEKYSPEKTIEIPAKRIIRDPWMTSGLIRSSKVMDQLYKKRLGKDKSHRSYIKYTKYRNMFNRIKRTQKQNYFNEQFSKFRHNALR